MINSICVCGAGTMGSGIAQLAAVAGYKTIQFDVNEEMLVKSKAAIDKAFAYLLQKEKLTTAQVEAANSNLVFTSNIQNCKADLVIEAIVEKLEIKVGLFKQLATINGDKSIYATNTSSLPVTDIAEAFQYPQQMAGMHFFNPAPIMKLVEIIKTKHTTQQVIDALYAVCKRMNKTAVLCKDAPGFIVNRVARHFYLEGMHLAEQGLADVATIDTMLEASGFKMGPFKLMDLIGMDINYSVSKIVWNALGQPERLTPSSLQKQKVEAGELGRKTGKGFYDYNQ